MEKVKEHDLYLIKFYIILIYKKIPRMNDKKFMKMGGQGATLLFLYEVTIVVLLI